MPVLPEHPTQTLCPPTAVHLLLIRGLQPAHTRGWCCQQLRHCRSADRGPTVSRRSTQALFNVCHIEHARCCQQLHHCHSAGRGPTVSERRTQALISCVISSYRHIIHAGLELPAVVPLPFRRSWPNCERSKTSTVICYVSKKHENEASTHALCHTQQPAACVLTAGCP